MIKSALKTGLTLIAVAGMMNASAQFQPPPPYKTDTGKKVFEALSSESRSEQDKARDDNRAPVETLEFFGLKDDMRVLELMPGGGWYTKLLGPALAEKGKLYLFMAQPFLAKALPGWGLDKVEIVETKTTINRIDEPGTFIFDVENASLPLKDLDMALTFRNLHNLTPAARAELNKLVFAALKPGGIYGVIDHTKRHMEPFSRETWRRLDPVLVIKEAQAAGFEFVDYADLHYRPDDELIYDTRRKAVDLNSDRFTLKFRKPE